MRAYSNYLVFEDLLDYVPTTSHEMNSLAESVLRPRVLMAAADCGTVLGSLQPTTYSLQGKIETATGAVITEARVNQLLGLGQYFTQVRTLSSCTATGGICQKCYSSSQPTYVLPAVNTYVQIFPEFEMETQVFGGVIGDTTFQLNIPREYYEDASVYSTTGLLIEGINYTISGQVLTLTSPLATAQNIVVHYNAVTTAPFMAWLANTYSGSMLGLSSVGSDVLPLRPSLITSYVGESRLQSASEFIRTFKSIPEDFLTYMDTIRDDLEKALYILALFTIFNSVTS